MWSDWFIDNGIRVGKISTFLSATSLSAATGFAISETNAVLALLSGFSFTSVGLYSIAKNFGMWRDIEKQIQINGELRVKILDFMQNHRDFSINLPEKVEDRMYIPKTFLSRQTLSFNVSGDFTTY